MTKSKIYSLSDEEFKEIIENSNSYLECCKNLGVSNSTTMIKVIKKRIKELNLSIENLSNWKKQTNSKIKYELDEVLVEDSPYTNAWHLKNRLIKENKLEYRCACCGNTGEWLGFPLILQLDHINGINTDNRLENLRFLCPNCHSQTPTFSGKNTKINAKRYYCIDCGKEISKGAERCLECVNINKRVAERPNRETLKRLIRTTPFTVIGKQFGVTDNTVRKWCDGYNLPRKSHEIKLISDKDWENI